MLKDLLENMNVHMNIPVVKSQEAIDREKAEIRTRELEKRLLQLKEQETYLEKLITDAIHSGRKSVYYATSNLFTEVFDQLTSRGYKLSVSNAMLMSSPPQHQYTISWD